MGGSGPLLKPKEGGNLPIGVFPIVVCGNLGGMAARRRPPREKTYRTLQGWKRGMEARMTREIIQRHRAQLRDKIKAAKKARAEGLRKVRAACSRARRLLSKALRDYRKRELARLTAEARAARAELRSRCNERKRRVIDRASSEIEAVRKAQREHAAMLKAERQAEDAFRRKKARVSKLELRGESDDDVRHNLPPELLPVWERHKRSFVERPKISRTEQFLRWVEENPDEVIAEMADMADAQAMAEIRKLEKAERSIARKLAKTKRHDAYMYTAEEEEALRAAGIDPYPALAAGVEGVPF